MIAGIIIPPRGNQRKQPIGPDAQVPVDKLAFDLAPNHQEENRHQPVIDPVMKIPWADALVEQTEY